PGIAIVRLHDMIGDELLVLLDHRVVPAPADQALDGEECIFRIGDRLALGRLADELFVIAVEGDDRGRGASPFRVLDDLRLLTFHDGDAGIGRSEVDPDDFCHLQNLLAADPGGSPIPALPPRTSGVRVPNLSLTGLPWFPGRPGVRGLYKVGIGSYQVLVKGKMPSIHRLFSGGRRQLSLVLSLEPIAA